MASAKNRLKSSYLTFEEALRTLLHKAEKEPVPIKTFLTTLSGRGKVLLLVFLSLGFGQIPGISFFLGLFIAYLGVRLAAGQSWVWLPQRILHKKIPSSWLKKVIRQILHLLKIMKLWTRPRLVWAIQNRGMRVLNGLMIALVGLSLAGSPPIPLTGFAAFIAIFSIGIGWLNDDGIYIFAGYLCALLYFAGVLCLNIYCSVGKLVSWVF